MSNVDLLRSTYEAFGRGDMPAVLGAMDPQIEWREAEGNPYEPTGASWIGPDAVVQNLFVKLGSDWDGFAAHPKEFYDAGDTVVVEGRYTGTNVVSGRSMDIQMAHVWKVRDGKLASFQQYVDTAALQAAMGTT